MKKLFLFILCLTLCLGGCKAQKEISETRFYFDTVITLKATCNKEVLNGAFELCAYYENLFSRTKEQSDIYKINNSDHAVTVSAETLEIIKKALYYSEISGGKYDITIASVTELYDFYKKILPETQKIHDALLNVDYKLIETDGQTVCLKKGKMDLGSIAKGYIADKLAEYFREKGVEDAVINLGGNLYIVGNKYKNVGIKAPFSNEIAHYLQISDASVVTSGIDQRFIEKNGIYYHHIIDKETGFGVNNSLASVTVISKSSADADALSTVCMLLGIDTGKALIEEIDGTEAVFIERNGNITFTSGLG